MAALLQDTIVIAPGKFAYDTTDVLIQEIEGQYVNKVRRWRKGGRGEPMIFSHPMLHAGADRRRPLPRLLRL